MYLHDLAGNRIPLGKVARTLEAGFLEGALPSWLTSDAGTVTYGSPASSNGYVQVETGAVNGNQARLRSFEFASANFLEIRLTVRALYHDADGAVYTPALKISNVGTDSAGVTLLDDHTSNNTILRLHTGGGNVDTTINYLWRGSSEGPRRRNLSLVVQPRTEQVYVLEDDQVMAHVDASANWTNGTLRAAVEVTTREAVAHWFRASQVELALVTS